MNLYARVFDGEPLSENDYVLSADEKPGVQARSRIPSQPPARSGPAPDAGRKRIPTPRHAGLPGRL